MRRTISLLVCVIALSSVSTFAQQGQAPRATTPPAAQGSTPTPPAARPIDVGLDPTDANITIEITVTDKAALTSTTVTRSGAITVANGNNGSVRGLSSYYGVGPQPKLDLMGLDIDARTSLRKSGMVSAALTVAYIPSGAEPATNAIQRQSATLFLRPGQETQVLTTGTMTGQGPAVRITAKATVVK